MRASSYTCLQVLKSAVGIQPHPVPFSAGARHGAGTDWQVKGNGSGSLLPSSLPLGPGRVLLLLSGSRRRR